MVIRIVSYSNCNQMSKLYDHEDVVGPILCIVTQKVGVEVMMDKHMGLALAVRRKNQGCLLQNHLMGVWHLLLI